MATNNNNDQWAQRSGIWLPDSTTRALEKANRPPVSAYALRQSDLIGRSVSSSSSRRDARRAKNLQQQLTDSYNKGVFYTSQATSMSYGLPGRGMEKPAGVAFAALRAVSKTSLIDAAIITALKDQARRYAQICDVPGKQRGFRVVHRKWQDPHFDSDTPDIRSRCAEMEELITRPTSPPHASFEDFLVNAIQEQLVIDRRCVVLTKDRAGRIGGYHLVDGTCYSADTEVLTRDGWKLFSEVNLDVDEFATRNQETKMFEWQKAFYFHEEYVDGEMLHFSSRTTDVLVTPNHRMVATVDDNPKYERIIPAEQLAVRSGVGGWQLPATSVWEGVELSEFVLEATNVRGMDIQWSGDDYAAFMGMWLSEGSLGTRGTVCVSQIPESKGYEEFGALLTRILGEEPCYTGKAWVFRRSALHRYLTQFGHAAEKFIPMEILNMSQRQLAIFWRFYMLGDGHYETRKAATERGADKRPSVFGGRQRISTVSKRMADQLQEIAQKLGYSSSVRMKSHHGRDAVMRDGRVIKAENSLPSYVVSLRTTKYQRFSTNTVPYRGKVYCVSVPNEVLYVRRNGQPIWCGNTVKPVIEVLAPWMTDEQGRHQYTSEQALYRMQADLWRNPPADPLSGRTVHIDLTDASYVQVLEGRVVSAWKRDEMMIEIANSTVEINHAFYGISPLESSIYLSILFSKAMRYNFNLFDVSFPEGILAITGDFDEEGLEAFKRAAFEFDESEASSRLPIITGDRDVEAKIISLRDTPRDMLFTEMMRWLANLKCAFYRIHPSLINVPEEGSAIQIGGADDAAVEQSIGDGFHGLMMSQANLLRRALVEPRYPDLTVIIEGLDRENEQLAIERLQINKTIQTINEVRVSQGLEALPDELPTKPGDFVADAGYLQVYNLLAQQAQQSQQQDMGQYEAGDFGQGGDEGQEDQSGGDDSGDDVQQGWQRGAQSSQSAAPQGGPGQGAPGASAQQFQQAQQGGSSGLFGKSRSLTEESGEVTVRVRLPRGKSLEDVLRGGDPTMTERDNDRGW